MSRDPGRRERSNRKERVLHTRVSEELSDDIRRFAEEVRVPASNLVRNVLEEVFSVVEHVSDDVGDLLGDLRDEARDARARIVRPPGGTRRRRGAQRGRAGPSADEDIETEFQRDERVESDAPRERDFPDILGWQPLLSNRAQACAGCGRSLQQGDEAFFGVRSTGVSDVAVCADCLPN